MDGLIIPIEMMEEEPALTASAELKSQIYVPSESPAESTLIPEKSNQGAR